ncbi:concanavalin A-like lectin/glucanase domain-containing protein [Haematococcus lacustris]
MAGAWQEPAPSELNIVETGYGVEVQRDRLSVKYVGEGRHSLDVGAVQANHPVPAHQLVYYYELTCVDQGEHRKIAIGFAEKGFKMNRQPGWEPHSYGYHGDDGQVYHAAGKGEAYGPTFGTGDTVGACLHQGHQTLFFTKNGVRLKTAFRSVTGRLYPTIGLHSKNEHVRLNFGDMPFKFDLPGLLREEQEAHVREVASQALPPQVVPQVVRDYLHHCGYAASLAALDSALLCPGLPEPLAVPLQGGGEAEAGCLALRQAVRQRLMAGEVDAALQLVQAALPQVLGPGYEEVQVQLYCQKYIELIRRGEVLAAVGCARSLLAPLRARLPQCQGTLRDVVALVAYQEPEVGPGAAAPGWAHRQAGWQAGNAAGLRAPCTQSQIYLQV